MIIKEKLDEIQEHAELIEKLASLIPSVNTLSAYRKQTVKREAQMIKELVASLKDDSE